jgi:hypothetical protein
VGSTDFATELEAVQPQGSASSVTKPANRAADKVGVAPDRAAKVVGQLFRSREDRYPESSFESQFNALTASSGVSLTQFSGFTPATTTGSTAASGSTTGTPVGVTAVPTTLAVTGDYQHIMKFISGLDSFPRLFVIQTFDLTVGTTSATTATAGAAPVAAAAPAAGAPALWAGQAETVPTASPYNLSITGSIYYTSTPSALAACTTATAPS